MPNRIEIDVKGSLYTFPINPIEFQDQNQAQYSIDQVIGDSSTRYVHFGDPRHRVMTWRGLYNRYPYTQLVSGLRHAVGISGVKLNFRDLNIDGDQNEWVNVFVEDVRVVYRKGRGVYNATNHLVYDLEMIYNIR